MALQRQEACCHTKAREGNAVYNLNLEKASFSSLDQSCDQRRARSGRFLACIGTTNTYAFDAEVDAEEKRASLHQRSTMDRQAPKGETLDIEIVFDSPGGASSQACTCSTS